ncbi:MAG: hypothetical protein BGO98_11025 [Myxococcales bacterium 68-20]|nr:hypothetical protein [Myxococcales bacterium]OJY16724.1 MAG: hypothetical protein BGO98_11025 [Myxococcales bacterium 68-20]
MKTTWLVTITVTATACALAVLAACATDGETPTALADDASTPLPSAATGDAGGDAETGEDASVCADDCEYYPSECIDDALCPDPLFGGAVAAPETLDVRTNVRAIAARSPTDAWLVGNVGAAAQFDGTSWKRSVTDTQYSFYALWLHGDAEIALNDPKRLFTRGLQTDAGAPSADGWSLFGAATLPSFWGTSRALLYTSWAHAESTSLWIGTTRSTRGGLWRLRDAAGGGFALTPVTLDKCDDFVACREVYGIHGRSADEVWAVGPRGAAFRVTNAEADEPPLTGFETDTNITLHGVWVAGTNDVWAVGSTGTVRRWRGDPRLFETYDEVPTKQHLRAISGSSPSDIWVAGDEGTVFHYDGTAWSRVKVAGLGPRRPQLEHIWIPSPGKVWIAGQGVLLSLGGKP